MAGEITETGELYSSYVGLVYMFNLIVGTGALTMPKAFATAGWLVSLVLLVFLGFMSFVTTTFVIEAMAAANAQLRWKRMESHKEEEDDDSAASDSDVLIRDNYERAEKRPILSVQRRGSPNLFEITDRVEMGQMASMFFNKVGVNLFYFCIIVYLYGDLAIYAAAVPFSLMQVTCSTTGNDSCGVEADTKYNDTDQCWGPLRRVDAYHIYLCWGRRWPRGRTSEEGRLEKQQVLRAAVTSPDWRLSGPRAACLPGTTPIAFNVSGAPRAHTTPENTGEHCPSGLCSVEPWIGVKRSQTRKVAWGGPGKSVDRRSELSPWTSLVGWPVWKRKAGSSAQHKGSLARTSLPGQCPPSRLAHTKPSRVRRRRQDAWRGRGVASRVRTSNGPLNRMATTGGSLG
ncbi:transmembrane protein 104 isoform X4 [Saimiri boliviensis]|uniref:transmembrane protein 104 isoform X4 n=1 Tax=Saimiri boliviensis TaxID=27679 RepID=UPI003D77D468